MNGEEVKNSLKFMVRGHTTGNIPHDPKLDEVKEVDNETQMRHSSVIKLDDFDIAYQPVKVKEVQLNRSHTIESELTEDEQEANAASVKLSINESVN